jgi:uncharacterized SAM-binding protein YcdF (DUF218 family)
MSLTLIAPGITIFFLIAFLIAYKINKTKLICSFLLNCFLLSFIGTIFVLSFQEKVSFLTSAISLLFFIFLLILALNNFIIIGLLFINAISVRKKEAKNRLANNLTLILAIAISILTLISLFINKNSLPTWEKVLYHSFNSIIAYYSLHFIHYFVNIIICNFARPRKNQHYIIVLGCRLIKNQVSPLLASRLDQAILFYQKQKLHAPPPKLILSGGQGKDEGRPEAIAMREYAHQKGIPLKDLIAETQSHSTLENFQFAKKLITKDCHCHSYRCIYVTSNYHVLRSGVIARRLGLKIDGIGSKTPLYYLPNAIIREYLAYLSLFKVWNIFISLFIILIVTIITLAT